MEMGTETNVISIIDPTALHFDNLQWSLFLIQFSKTVAWEGHGVKTQEWCIVLECRARNRMLTDPRIKVHRNECKWRIYTVWNGKGIKEQSLNEPIRCRQFHQEFFFLWGTKKVVFSPAKSQRLQKAPCWYEFMSKDSNIKHRWKLRFRHLGRSFFQ